MTENSKMFDYLVNGGDKVAELEASLEHMGGCLGVEIEESAKLRAKYTDMRNAIDGIDLALHGIDHMDELEALWQDARDDLKIKVEMDVATFRQIRAAMEECNRIINSEEYPPLTSAQQTTVK